MKINLKQVVALSLAVLLAACSPAIKKDNKDTGGQEKVNNRSAAGQVIPVKTDKDFLTENGLQIINRRISGEKSELNYPEIQGLVDTKTQDRINADIKDSITALSKEIWAGKQADHEKDRSMPGVRQAGHTVYGNYNNVLSIRQWFFFSYNNFHEEWVKTFTYDLNTGDRLGLKDVFVKGADYKSLVNSSITEQIIRQNLDESSLCRPFEGIAENQEFYITENEIVFCFNPDKQWFNTPNMSNLEFRIPFNRLSGKVDIYDKFIYPSRKLYTQDKLVRKWLPNDLEIISKKHENKGNKYVIEAQYFEIAGIKDKSFEDRINRTMEEGAKKIVTDQEFIKKAEKIPIKQEGFSYKTRHNFVAGNFAGKMCIVEEDNEYFPGEQPLHSRRSYCYDIRKARLFTLQDLFGKYPGYQDIIMSETKTQIRKAGHNPDSIQDFDSLAKKAVFYYDQNTINLFFKRGTINKDDDYQAVIDFSVFGEDSYKIFE